VTRAAGAATKAATGVVVLGALLLGLYLFVPRDYYTGTNAVRTRGFVIELNPTRHKLCLPALVVPAGTGRMELEVDTGGQPRPALHFDFEGHRDTIAPGPAGRTKLDFAVPVSEREVRGTACIATTGGKVFFGGVPTPGFGEEMPTIDGAPANARPAIWYRPPAGQTEAIALHLPTLFGRMALFKPTWTGTWTYWVLFLLVAPALVLAAIRLLLRPDRRRLALLIGLVGFANAAVWAHVTPAFDAPDESEHFAYVQSLAERGKPSESTDTGRPPYSTQESVGLQATRVLDGAETADGKPPWSQADDRLYSQRQDAAPRDDGGGFTVATNAHSPLFYSLGVPAYLAAQGDLFDELVATRLVSALLGGLVAACACLIVLELAPTRRRVAAAAGVAVAFQPMFAFMSGVVNNDMGVNAGAAVVTLLLVRLLRRGFSWPLAIGLGTAVAVTPLLKATGYAVYPATALALLVATWRSRAQWRRWVPGVALVLGAVIAVIVIWGQVSNHFDRGGAFTTPGGGAPGEGAPALQDPTGTLTYIWEIFLPRLPGMAEHWAQSWPAFDIFGLRGWGAFGWYALTWPHIVYWVILPVLVALTLLGLTLLPSPQVRSRLPELLVLLALVGGTIGVMTAAYYVADPQGSAYPEQGRYVFPAITSLAALFALSTQGARRFATPLVTGLATAVVCLGYASLWLVLGGFYFAA
jgi:hypothetical protein